MHLERDLGHLRNQTTNGKAIRTNRQILMREHVFQLQSVDNRKYPIEQRLRDFETYEVVILFRRITILCHLQCIESKLGLQMRGRVVGIAYGSAIFGSQFWIVDGNSLIDGWVAVDVGRIVRQRAQGKGILVRVLAFAHQLDNEVPAAHIMHQVAEVLVAERVVSKVLNDRAAVGISMRLFDLVFGNSWKPLHQKRPNLRDPQQIDNLLVGQDGVCKHISARHQQQEKQSGRTGKKALHRSGHGAG